MKAISFHTYGTQEVLRIEEVETPVPGDNELLVNVKASSVNSWDWDILRGTLINRILFGGFTKPKLKILGADIAGVVTATGKKVTKFKIGNEVYGDLCRVGWGGFSEYVKVPEKELTLKPAEMSFEHAAALPQAGVMALQSIFDIVTLHPGEKVLINGAGGGVGTLAIQMAKSQGTEVTAVDSQEKLKILRSIGADHVIDYRNEDFTKNGLSYNLIIDVVSNRSIFSYKNSLKPGGTFIMVGGTGWSLIQGMLLGGVLSKIGGKNFRILVHEPNKDLEKMNSLYKSGTVVPVIHNIYALSETPKALESLGNGSVIGKNIVSIN